MEAFFAWAKEIQEAGRLIKDKTLEGINYCINQEEALKAFLDDGEVPLDNNATEGVRGKVILQPQGKEFFT